MENTFNLAKWISLGIILFFIFALVPEGYSQTAPQPKVKKTEKIIILDFNEEQNTLDGKQFPKILLHPDQVEKEYSEGSMRRFEIVFFLSLPFILGYQFLIHQLITSNASISGTSSGSISGQQWMYMGISSFILAMGVGYSDYIEVSKIKEHQHDMSATKSALFYPENSRVQLAWTFRF